MSKVTTVMLTISINEEDRCLDDKIKKINNFISRNSARDSDNRLLRVDDKVEKGVGVYDPIFIVGITYFDDQDASDLNILLNALDWDDLEEVQLFYKQEDDDQFKMINNKRVKPFGYTIYNPPHALHEKQSKLSPMWYSIVETNTVTKLENLWKIPATYIGHSTGDVFIEDGGVTDIDGVNHRYTSTKTQYILLGGNIYLLEDVYEVGNTVLRSLVGNTPLKGETI